MGYKASQETETCALFKNNYQRSDDCMRPIARDSSIDNLYYKYIKYGSS